MERAKVLDNLAQSLKRRGQPKKDPVSTPFVLRLLQKCILYRVQDCLITRLNYKDLLALVVELDIDEINKMMSEMKHAKEARKGYRTVEATPEMATNFLR